MDEIVQVTANLVRIATVNRPGGVAGITGWATAWPAPGELELARQPDEDSGLPGLVNAANIIALATLDLMPAGR